MHGITKSIITVNGEWGSWLAWSPLLSTCGRTARLRYRQCDSPYSQNGGSCVGDHQETQIVLLQKCPGMFFSETISYILFLSHSRRDTRFNLSIRPGGDGYQVFVSRFSTITTTYKPRYERANISPYVLSRPKQ